MARLLLSKASLHKQGAQLKRYQQYLPSLDLKRQQLIAERAKAMQQLENTEAQIEECRRTVAETLPMLGDKYIDLDGLVTVRAVTVDEENVVGVRLPVLESIDIVCKPYSHFSQPHWVDPLVMQLKIMLELQMRLKVERERLEILQCSVKKVTQRVNLFDKVLIPKAKENIRKIRIYLSDAERVGVVRAKITKQKRLSEDRI